MPRQSRTSPLPDVARAEVSDAATQRAVTAIVTAIQAIVAFLRPFKEPEAWRPMTYGANWAGTTLTTLAQPAFRKDAMNTVMLRGWAACSGTATSIAILPIGYRPALRLSFACPAVSGTNQYARIDVVEDGRVVLVAPTAAAAVEVSLSNIRFSVEA